MGFNCFGTHETLDILEHCFANNIRLCRLPSHTSHKLQRCDVAVFAPLKIAYRDEVERLERGGVNTIGKQHFTSMYSRAREAAFTRRNIHAGWSKSGLAPLNSQRVLKDMEKPRSDTVDAAGAFPLVPRDPQHESPALTAAPITPVTPVTAEAFASLRDLILERDGHTLNDAERQNLQRHLQKLTKAAQMSIARGALQQERIEFLHEINNEAKVRRATKSHVLGKAKVMSYEDLEAARVKRKEKEAGKSGKQRRVRKRKQKAEKTCLSSTSVQAAAVRMPELVENLPPVAGTPVERGASLLAPCPGNAPVAQMW